MSNLCRRWLRVRWGSRAYAYGGKLYEVGIGARLILAWAPRYDHLEDLHNSGDRAALILGKTWAFGVIARLDYVRLYSAVGVLTFDWCESGDFDTIYQKVPA